MHTTQKVRFLQFISKDDALANKHKSQTEARNDSPGNRSKHDFA